ncbi:substrate-binding domain-containing protein [Variovorax sp. J2P1-59]|uniref:extracellular solute-binding protein n=1 Tax=Variovorax flavidus TaxID=3053501 RepID=UPI0025764C89|nr:extracellular solute-binding protein [Variovorax sp. J2P1-59]MDM0073685.1 substrate-binding domain-containing protein [Variovorax sp. J2P1-59]
MHARQRILGSGALLVSALSSTVSAQPACAPGAPQVIIYHAGSLTAAFSQVEKLFTAQTGICVVDVAAGSVDAARRVTAGKEPCDIYASADAEDIDVLLKPGRHADYNISFAQGAMVLAYNTASRNASTIAAPNIAFNPPAQIPPVVDDWHAQLTQAGVLIGGSNPFLDPSGYRSDLMFQLAERRYQVPNLYNTLVGHYTLTRTGDVLGKNFDYQFTYEHSAYAAYLANPQTYRYASLPPEIGLSDPELNRRYRQASIEIPGLHAEHSQPFVRLPATRVVWGLTILKTAPNEANAVKFLQTLFSEDGRKIQQSTGPMPIVPPVVSHSDFRDLQPGLRGLVRPVRDEH